jgi:phosphoglycerol transferase MdoB-like AlkP superfamily enzyme
VVVAFLAWRLLLTEGGPATIIFATAAAMTLASLIVLATRRLLIAAVVISALITTVAIASMLKLRAVNMVLHAYDLVFYLSSWSTLSFLWQNYRGYAVALLAALLVTGLTACLAYRFDGTRIRRRHAAGASALFAAIAWLAVMAMGERRHSQFEYEGQYISSFFLSWSETIETLLRGQLIEAAASAQGPIFTVPTACEPASKPPHIILIHQESVVPPSYFPTLKYDNDLDPFFHSHDGLLHKLRVETYGGASSLTEFSILTGLSTRSFGGMRQFVQSVMANKLSDTLPQALTRCGYRNVVFYPMLRSFVFTSRFFSGVGLNEMFDLKDQGAKAVNERDRFYYGNALAEMERHFATSAQPLFTFVETMATHWPYHITYMPEVDVPGGGAGTNPEMHEYLRRLSMARIDYNFLTAELARRFPHERFVIVHYGDHHPMATRTLLEYSEGTEAEDVLLDPNSIGFVTYYAINGVNYQPPPLPPQATLDVPYLGTVMLDAARLPLSDAFRARQRLIEACSGRYHDCAKPQEILRFHRRLIDAGLMQSR